MKTRFIFHEERCVGCGACTIACMDQNDIPAGQPVHRTVIVSDRGPEGPCWHFTAQGCAHCADAPCIPACPVSCLFRDGETGLVIGDAAGCVGCGNCAAACPHQAIHFTAQGKIAKCNGCVLRVREGLLPPCVKVCPHGALRFVP